MDQELIILQMGPLLKSIDGGTELETDEFGNPIIYAPASTEAVDQDGQVVLQRALTGSTEYFKRNGTISWDHKHLRPDPQDKEWSASKYIIGEPLDVVTRGKNTYVKAKLYRSNPIVQDIIQKLKDGATVIKTSVGGLRPQVIQEFDAKLRKPVEKVVSVLWNELALTYKPVNDALSPVGLTPAAFLKSLEMGYSTNPATATGGAALVTQDLEGADKKSKSKKNHVTAIITALAFGDVKNEKEARQLLKNRGCSDEDTTSILQHLVDNKQLVKGVLNMDAELTKSFDDSIAELEKAMGGKGKPDPKPQEKDEDFGFDPEAGGDGHAEPDEDNEGGASDGDADNAGEGEGEAEADKDEKGGKGMRKSIYDTVSAAEGDYLDVAPFLRTLTKSISDAFEGIREEIRMEIGGVKEMQKSMGKLAIVQAQLTKSQGNAPAPRQAQLAKSERVFTGANGQKQTMSRNEIMQKSIDAVGAGKFEPHQVAVIEDRLNRGQAIPDDLLRIING